MEFAAFGLGESLRGQREYAQAADAYELAASSAKDAEQRQKATLSAGEMYDLLQKRDNCAGKI